MTIFNDQLSDWTKKLQNTSQSQICTKQRSWSLFGGLLLIDYPFLNPNKTNTSEKYAQQIHKVHQKLQCLQPTLVNRKGPILCNDAQQHVAQSTFQKLNKLSYKVLPHTPYSPDLSPTDYHFSSILTSFCRGNASTTSRREKMFYKSSSNPKAWIFMLQK